MSYWGGGGGSTPVASELFFVLKGQRENACVVID
jgi:hypothetical protein